MISLKNLKRYSDPLINEGKLSKLSLWIFVGLLAYMPLHIFLSTWFGASFGVLEFAKIAKDIVLIVGFSLVLMAGFSLDWLKLLKTDRLAWSIGLYALLTVSMALFIGNDQDAELLGVLYNLRFLVFFIYGILIARLYRPEWLRKNVIRVVLAAAFIVMAFGFIQYMWLPNDALKTVGYSRDNGVLPVFYIDEKPDLERIMSTVRDPNSLGSYLIIVFSLVLTFFLTTKNKDLKRIYGGLLTLSLICIWFTFSRSAWIGLIAATCVLAALLFKQKKKIKLNKSILIGFAVLLLLSLGALYTARNTYFVKNVILHADESTVLEDPNQLRIRFWQESIEAGIEKPLGYGPGTAGLASIRNEEQGTILNENYYLQILHEVGIVGLILFLIILGIVAYRLYQLALSGDSLALALLASFVGLALTNFLVHIWSNEAVAYTWWGLAGIVLLRPIIPKTKRNSNNTKAK